jgi:hypothetical protein
MNGQPECLGHHSPEKGTMHADHKWRNTVQNPLGTPDRAPAAETVWAILSNGSENPQDAQP